MKTMDLLCAMESPEINIAGDYEALLFVGQIKEGCKLKFTYKGVEFNRIVKEVLDAGTYAEEIILDAESNLYFATSSAIDGRSWAKDIKFSTPKEEALEIKKHATDSGKHYRSEYKGIKLDPYRIASIYGLDDHALFSAPKKILVAGRRGGKGYRRDIEEAIDALNRTLEMLDEDETN